MHAVVHCRDRAQQVAKDEIAEMQRQVSRSGVDTDYLKAVLVDGFEAGELPATSNLFPVLSRLLSFSPIDVARARAGGSAKKGDKKAAPLTRLNHARSLGRGHSLGGGS